MFQWFRFRGGGGGVCEKWSQVSFFEKHWTLWTVPKQDQNDKYIAHSVGFSKCLQGKDLMLSGLKSAHGYLIVIQCVNLVRAW